MGPEKYKLIKEKDIALQTPKFNLFTFHTINDKQKRKGRDNEEGVKLLNKTSQCIIRYTIRGLFVPHPKNSYERANYKSIICVVVFLIHSKEESDVKKMLIVK